MQNGKQYREAGIKENKEALWCVSHRWCGRALCYRNTHSVWRQI